MRTSSTVELVESEVKATVDVDSLAEGSIANSTKLVVEADTTADANNIAGPGTMVRGARLEVIVNKLRGSA